MQWLKWVGTVIAALMIAYGTAIMIWPQLHAARPMLVRRLGAFVVLLGLFLLAGRFQLLG